ncbi:MAG: ferrous iron transport protein A [Puniceicoccales bacterium]|jgi:ferrous iron transport protein A|nr:ferrous iron transport protein A [Puniceicoccales bacterium]
MDISSLKVGQRARVVHLHASQPAEQRLMALGLMPGVIVRLARVAPLGDPIAIEFRGQCVSMRKREAGVVEVEPLG